jgi:hypothetical protein
MMRWNGMGEMPQQASLQILNNETPKKISKQTTSLAHSLIVSIYSRAAITSTGDQPVPYRYRRQILIGERERERGPSESRDALAAAS